MSMYRNICVTNRALAVHPFEEQIARVLEAKPYALILREKDLSEEEYEKLAGNIKRLCDLSETQLILHSFPAVAEKLGVSALHMPLSKFLAMTDEEKAAFTIRGASVHSVEDALLAERAGATYVTAGHIFATDCKKGLPGRGLDFLRDVCTAVKIPVYAIGGIGETNTDVCIKAGAAGVCMMSGYMKLQKSILTKNTDASIMIKDSQK